MALASKRMSTHRLPDFFQKTSNMKRPGDLQFTPFTPMRRFYWPASFLWASLFFYVMTTVSISRASWVRKASWDAMKIPRFTVRTTSASSAPEPASGPDQMEHCTKVLDIALIIDESASVGQTNFRRVREFLAGFIKALPVSKTEVQVAAVAYGLHVRTLWDYSDSKATNKDQAVSAAAGMSYGAGAATYTHAAIDAGLKILTRSAGARRTVPKVMIVLTDGSSSKRSKTLESARIARQSGVQMFVIGVGSANSVECRHVCGCSNGPCPQFLSTTWSTLSSKVLAMMGEVCKKLPKDAVCSPWSDWSTCSVSCGEGTRTKKRSEISAPLAGDPPCEGCPALVGRTCAEQGGLEITEPCNPGDCPVNAGCGEWGPWSPISAMCGITTQVRHRQGYNNPPPRGAGLYCEQQTPPVMYEETREVTLPPCIYETLGEWSEWSPCSVTCGVGAHHRTRTRTIQSGTDEPKEEVEQEEKECDTTPCPVNAECGDFGEWSPCSKSCGGGTSVRQRNPWLSNEQYGGKTCLQQHPDGREQRRECNTQHCPVDEVVGEWLEWGECSVTCGHGTMRRVRQPSSVQAANGGLTVEEQIKHGRIQVELEETKECNPYPCGPCAYTFDAWSGCRGRCGSEIRTRHAAVKFDYPTAKCNLPTFEVESCVSPSCAEGAGSALGGGAAGGPAGGEEAGGTTGKTEEPEKEEDQGVPAAAIAGGVVGGAMLLGAIAGGAYYSLAGKAAQPGGIADVQFGEEAPQEAPEEDREAMIAIDEESEMWRT